MRILKIKGKDEESIHKQIEKEYGENVVIISSHKERASGIKGWFQKAVVTVTIAIEEGSQEVDEKEVAEESGFDQTNQDAEKEIDTQDLASMRAAILSEILSRQTMNSQLESVPEEASTEPIQKDQKSLKQMITRGLLNEGIAVEVVNDLIEDIKESMSVDEIARILYIKLVEAIKVDQNPDENPYIFFIGSTGVGKTTTIAKLTAGYVLNQGKKVTLFTSDTYRIAAIDQLKTYAEIIDVPVEVIYETDDFKNYIDKWNLQDYILIDTAGRSHKNITEIEKVKEFLAYVPNKKIFLVLNMSTNYKDAQNIIDVYKEVVGEFSLILTKLDETDAIGNLINIASYAKMPIAYVANGQDVPDDIEKFEVDAYIKQLLGRISYE